MKRVFWLFVLLLVGCAPGNRAEWRQQLDADVKVVCGSADGARVFTFSHGVLSSLDAATGQEISAKNLDGFAPSKLSSQGDYMFAYSAEGTELLYWRADDLESIRKIQVGIDGKPVEQIELRVPGDDVPPVPSPIVSAGIFSNGILAVCDASGSTGLWNDNQLETKITVKGGVAGSALSPDGKMLVLIESQKVHLFRLPEAAKVGEISHNRQLRGLRFSPDGQYLSLTLARQVKLVRSEDLVEVASLPGVAERVSFSADGRYFCATNVGSIDVWDIKKGRARGSITLLSVVQSEVLGPTPHVLTLRRKGVDLWSLDQSEEPIWSYRAPIRMMSVKPDGVWLYTAGGWLESWRLPLNAASRT